MKKQILLSTALFSFSPALILSQAVDAAETPAPISTPSKPNVVFILADDAGVNDFGCYNQKIIQTPHIDQLANEGIRFTQHYAGAPVCAPSRCSLLTGQHMGHATIRDNKEVRPEGQAPIEKNDFTLAELFKKHGYATAAIGKWGLGPMNSEGSPLKQGFDYFYGYNCQRAAHNHYPVYLWENNKRVKLRNHDFSAHQTFIGDESNPNDFAEFSGIDYAPDLMLKKALEFIKQNQGHPFFLYFPTTLPHVALQVPKDRLKQYDFIIEEGAYLGQNNYLPCMRPRSTYAAMISTIDTHVGKMMNLISSLGLDEETIFVFTSDNGPTFNGGTDTDYFQSKGLLRGLKEDLYEGGIRVPLIVRWKGQIAPSTTTDHLSALYDFLPTFSEILGETSTISTDGLSLCPTLLAKGEQKEHSFLYWEAGSKSRAIRQGNWKGIQMTPMGPLKLYNLAEDPYEEKNVAIHHYQKVQELKSLIKEAHTPSTLFPMLGDRLFYQ